MCNNELERATELIQKILSLLENHGEDIWAVEIRLLLKKWGTPMGLGGALELFRWFGGLGSFSDVKISSMNGHDLKGQDEVEINSELRDLRSQLYELCEHLKRKME